MNRKSSFRTSFVISKRKNTQPNHDSSSANERNSDIEHRTPTDPRFAQTPKRASNSLNRHNRSKKKVEVLLKPKLFEDEVIPEQLGSTMHSPWMGLTTVKKEKGATREKR